MNDEGRQRMTAMARFCFDLVTKNDQSTLIGSRITISEMMSINGFHLRSVDIFSYSKYHPPKAEYFLNWIEKLAFRLRGDNSNNSFVFDDITIKAAYCSSCKLT